MSHSVELVRSVRTLVNADLVDEILIRDGTSYLSLKFYNLKRCCMPSHKFSVVVEKDEDGYYAYCPELQGCYAQGDTYEEVIKNIEDAIKLHIEDMKEAGEPIKSPEMTCLTQIEVAV